MTSFESRLKRLEQQLSPSRPDDGIDRRIGVACLNTTTGNCAVSLNGQIRTLTSAELPDFAGLHPNVRIVAGDGLLPL